MGQQDTLIEYFYPADNYGKGLLYHCCLGLKERDARRYTQEDTPKAVKAAINEERCLAIF